MDVLLVNPNRMKPAVAPIGLDYLGDALSARGHHVELLDLCFEADPRTAVRAHLAHSDPRLVGMSIRNTDDCYFASQECFIPYYSDVVRWIREGTDAPIVLGGVGYSVMPEAVLRRVGVALGVDDDAPTAGRDRGQPEGELLGVAGDGENALAGLADRLQAGESWHDLPGLLFRRGDAAVLNAPLAGPLDDLPSRTRQLVNNARYFREGGQGGVETKRGCNQKCIYCADPVAKGSRCRLRSPESVADEFEALVRQGVDCIHLCDAEFNIPRRHAQSVCHELTRRGLGERVRWYAYLSPQPFDGELAASMRRAGCVGINFGADSGDDGMLARLRRPYRSHDLRSTVDACKKQGITCMFDLLIGGPGETLETLGRTISMMKEIEPDRVGASVGVRVYPGTPLGERVRKEALSRENPHLQGRLDGNDDMALPVYYVSSALGRDPVGEVRKLVAGDERFYVGGAPGDLEANYNYNGNGLLVDAIRRGHRGAYWDILRQLGAR